MSSSTKIQSNGQRGVFLGDGPAAQAGNKALEQGFDLKKAAGIARKETGKGPGAYFHGSKAEFRPQNANPEVKSQRVSASNVTRWKNYKENGGKPLSGNLNQGFKNTGV